jgi:uncharacterized protein YqgC (DUF456 family)
MEAPLLHLYHSLLFGITVGLIVIGLLGTIVPILPGPLLILGAIVGYAWLNDFRSPTLPWLLLIGVIMAATGSADIWLPLLGANLTGISWWGTLYGIVGGIIGLFWFPPFGSLLGYALGILLGAWQTHRDWPTALRASLGGLAGRGVAVVVQLGGGLVSSALFFYAVLGQG